MKPAKRKPNRPNGKRIHVAACLTPHELAWIQREAKSEGLKVSAFLRLQALRACRGYDPTALPSDPLPGQRAIPGTGVSDVE